MAGLTVLGKCFHGWVTSEWVLHKLASNRLTGIHTLPKQSKSLGFVGGLCLTISMKHHLESRCELNPAAAEGLTGRPLALKSGSTHVSQISDGFQVSRVQA